MMVEKPLVSARWRTRQGSEVLEEIFQDRIGNNDPLF